MTATEAARLIGCSRQQVLTLARKGLLAARRVKSPVNQLGYCWIVSQQEAERYRDSVQSRGWPRGKSRDHKQKKD